MSVKVELSITIKCDKCNGSIHNHYAIDQLDMNVVQEVEKLAELNDCDFENIDCSDGHIYCDNCRED